MWEYYDKIHGQVSQADFKLDFFPKVDENSTGRNAANVFKAEQKKQTMDLCSSSDAETPTPKKKKKRKENTIQ